MLLEPGPGEQAYVEDCEVCCNPISVRFRMEDGVVSDFEAGRLE